LLDEPAEENTLTGRLGEVTYFGDSAHFEFEAVGRDGQPLTPPTRLRICELNPRSWEGRREKTLFAYADPDDVVVLPMA
jgi:hypothetical protein